MHLSFLDMATIGASMPPAPMKTPHYSSPPSETRASSQPQIAQAKSICETCAVKGNCLHFALVREDDGIAGSLLLTERRQLSERARHWLKIANRSSS